MPKITFTLTAGLLAGLALSTPALAQDMTEPVSPTETVDYFATADADLDGALNRDEFVVYVASRSNAGDSHYDMIASTGEYERYYVEKDEDADGYLQKDELTPLIKAHDMPGESHVDDEDTIQE